MKNGSNYIYFLFVCLFIFCSGIFNIQLAHADIDYVIPVTLTYNSPTRSDLICDIPPYSTSTVFASYKIGTIKASSTGATGSENANIGTPSEIACTFAFNIQSSGGILNDSLIATGTTYYIVLYESINFVNPYGYYSVTKVSNTGNIQNDYVINQGISNPTNTRITLISPSNNSTTTATTTTFTIEYYLNSETETGKNPTSIQITYFNANAVGGIQNIILPITPVYDTLVSTSTTVTLLNNNNYKWFARINGTTLNPICANPLISIALCAFQNASAGLNQIATTPTWTFTIGTNPLTSISNYANSIFNTVAGVDDVDVMGSCAFVATSTCDATSPSTYLGCFINGGIALFCPSQSVLNNATTTLFNSLQNKKVFATIFQTIDPLLKITSSTTPTEGSDVNINIDSLGNATTTMVSWEGAKEFMDEMIGEGAINILIYLEWIVITILSLWLIIKFF